MKLDLKDLDSLNLHDSKILRVEERAGSILMEFDAAIICLPLRQPDGKAWLVRNCLFACYKVTTNEKREWNDGRPKQWDDARLLQAVSYPDLPIDEVGSVEIKDGFLFLHGFSRGRKFVSWKITANSFELDWKTQREFQ